MLPPTQFPSDDRWSCKGVRYNIGIRCTAGGDWWLRKSDVWSFSKEHSDRGWHDFIAWEKIHCQSGWLNFKQVELEAWAQLPLPVPLANPALQRLDLSQEAVMVKFLLKDSAPIFFDKRLLTARCEYFQEMFAQTTWREALTSEIDMRSDSDADSRSMSALCIFLMSDVFDAQGDKQLAMLLGCHCPAWFLLSDSRS